MDVVYPLRDQTLSSSELIYSLRSICRYLEFDQVHVFGFNPTWLRNVNIHPFEQGKDSRRNTTRAMELACLNKEVSDPFLWFNDDMFVMKEVSKVLAYNRGPIEDVIVSIDEMYGDKKLSYRNSMRQTKSFLGTRLGILDPLSYELHVPLVVHKDIMSFTLRKYGQSGIPNLNKRTIYGNLLGESGPTIVDPKITGRVHRWDGEFPFLSTNDFSFHSLEIGHTLRNKFSRPCYYEV